MAYPATPNNEMDIAIEALQSAKDQLVALSIPERIELLEDIIKETAEVADAWIEKALEAKGLPKDSPYAGEELLAGPMCIYRNARFLIRSLREIEKHGKPKLPRNPYLARNGQTIVPVYPIDTLDKLMLSGTRAEIWMQPDVKPEDVRKNMALAYDPDRRPGGMVALVLGAGNVASIGPLDVFYKLFAENQVCILKMNPVNEYLGPLIEQSFRRLIEKNFLRLAYGGAEVGAYLCTHPDIETIHITGSDQTHDMIVWGPPGPEREARKAANNPVNSKPITSELGNVSPVIVAPAKWSKKEIQFQARHLATMVVNNGSFNCNATKIIITHKQWPQREELLNELELAFQELPPRKAYYPGAHSRYQKFIDAHQDAKRFGEATEGVIPWTVIRDVDSEDPNEICFSTEAFCGVVAETALDAPDEATFLRKAADFCNERIWGTLNCCLLVHPSTEKDLKTLEALDEAIAELRYGTIAINHWPAIGYGLISSTWGAHHGHTLDDIQSGIGVVHNSLLLEGTQKCVIHGPFMPFPKPPWLATRKNMWTVAQRLTDFEYKPSYWRLIRLASAALRT